MVLEDPYCLSCAKCCMGTQMVLAPSDVERLRGRGLEGFYVMRGPFLYLRNVGGRCVFLDKRTRRCKVYEYRPLGCRVYPLVFDEARGALIDTLCPLSDELGRRKDELRRACALLAELLAELSRCCGYPFDRGLLERSCSSLAGER